MKTIGYGDICAQSGSFANVNVYYRLWMPNSVHDYERSGRQRHLVYCQIKGQRRYFHDGKLLLIANPGDILCIPDGVRYYTDLPPLYNPQKTPSAGIGVSFDLLGDNAEPVAICEPLRIVAHDDTGEILRLFEQLMQTFLRPGCAMRFNGTLHLLLDRIFSAETPDNPSRLGAPRDIAPAIGLIENHPEQNLSNRELASMCFISEASFLRKFKEYSGGVTPVQYRNRIRLTMAEELAATSKTLQEIAEMLGFYDAPHLCRTYKQHKKRTLRKPGV